jgi:hypothetical protein
MSTSQVRFVMKVVFCNTFFTATQGDYVYFDRLCFIELYHFISVFIVFNPSVCRKQPIYIACVELNSLDIPRPKLGICSIVLSTNNVKFIRFCCVLNGILRQIITQCKQIHFDTLIIGNNGWWNHCSFVLLLLNFYSPFLVAQKARVQWTNYWIAKK